VVGREPKGRRKQKIKYFATEKVTTKNEWIINNINKRKKEKN
jgi:hypothetical protein